MESTESKKEIEQFIKAELQKLLTKGPGAPRSGDPLHQSVEEAIVPDSEEA
jgi:hypothetical protein